MCISPDRFFSGRGGSRLLPALFLLATLSALRGRVRAAGDALEDPRERAALPEFRVIPAATPEELTPAAAISQEPFARWTRSQGDNGARRYSALKQITRANVASLERAWTYHSKDGADNIQCTPIVVDGLLFAPTAGRAIVALDAATGVERWRFQGETPAHLGLEDSPARRGLVFWPGDSSNAPRILFGSGDWIYALDPKTGRTLSGFGVNGRTSIPTGSTTSCAVYRNVFVTSGLYGDIYGYDVRTGESLWRFHTIARPGEFGGETWSKPQAGADAWGGLSIDDQRGIAYIAIGNPSPDMVGTERLGDNLFSDCVLALDVLTGKRLWHFQMVRHDLWDLDVCGVPNLVTIVCDGRRIDAVTGFSKRETLVVLDRVSGKPIFPFRLRRAPVSTLPGERTAPLSAGSGVAGANFPNGVQPGRHHDPHRGSARFRSQASPALRLRILCDAYGRETDFYIGFLRRRRMVRCGGGCPDGPALRDLESLGLQDHGHRQR